MVPADCGIVRRSRVETQARLVLDSRAAGHGDRVRGERQAMRQATLLHDGTALPNRCDLCSAFGDRPSAASFSFLLCSLSECLRA